MREFPEEATITFTATGTGKRSTSPAFVVIFCLYHRGLSRHLTLTPALFNSTTFGPPSTSLCANSSTYTASGRHGRLVIRWLMSECVEARRHRRRLERRFQLTRSMVLAPIAARSVRRVQIDQTSRLLRETRSDYIRQLDDTRDDLRRARSTNSFTRTVVTGCRVTQPTTPVWQTASVLSSLTNCGPYKSGSPTT